MMTIDDVDDDSDGKVSNHEQYKVSSKLFLLFIIMVLFPYVSFLPSWNYKADDIMLDDSVLQ